MDLTSGSDARPGGQGLLGQTAGRTKKGVVTWLEELSQDWRDIIRIVAMDPCATYRRAVEQPLPTALVVADYFHPVFTKMWNVLVDGDPSGQILTRVDCKEELRALFATARRGGQRHDVAHRLTRLYAWCAGPGQSMTRRVERQAREDHGAAVQQRSSPDTWGPLPRLPRPRRW